MKELLINLCKNLERLLNNQNWNQYNRNTIELRSELRIAHSHLPEINFSKGKKEPVRHAWYGEILINGKCNFRETMYYPPSTEINLIQAEEDCLIRLLNSVFNSGIVLNYKILNENNSL